jgi:hypothetical protein
MGKPVLSTKIRVIWSIPVSPGTTISIWNLIVEVDAKFIKGMLAPPDVALSASINWWILSILMFYFTLVHVPGTHCGPNGLS